VGALTGAEQAEFMALMDQRIARGEEKLEAVSENVRAAKALLVLLVRSGAPGDMGIGQALWSGYIGIQDVVEAIRGVVPPELD
jgi:hypothetical protein